jgi:hypothetical protein
MKFRRDMPSVNRSVDTRPLRLKVETPVLFSHISGFMGIPSSGAVVLAVDGDSQW